MYAGTTCRAQTITDRREVEVREKKRLLCESAAKRICFAVPARLLPDLRSYQEESTVALKMTSREVDGVTVVALDGRIVLGEESNALREKIKSMVAEGKKKIVLNMDGVTFIDSAGLGTLVAAHHSAKAQGASLRLCHLGTKFQEVLQITKLMTIFDVYNTEAEAVASFSKP
jgi:anti-sigma B factor antagonist